MNILLLPSWYPSKKDPLDGVFFKEQAESLKRYMDKNGLEGSVTVLCLYSFLFFSIIDFLKQRKEFVTEKINGITTCRSGYITFFPRKSSLFLWISARMQKKIISKLEKKMNITFDIVHIHSAIPAGIFYHLSKCTIPYVITEHSTKYSRDTIPPAYKKYIPFVLNEATKIYVVGRGLKKKLEMFTKKNVSVLYNIVQSGNYSLNKKKNEVFLFFSLGLNLYVKGFDILLDAFSKISARYSCKLKIAGLVDSERKKLEEMPAYNRCRDKVILSRQLSREEVAQAMKACDCFVLVSRHETFGVVFAEAMFYGKPVIASATGGPDSFVIPETGMLVPIENISETAKAMEAMILNIDTYDSEYIHQYAVENFDENVICKKLFAAYGEVLLKEKQS